MVNKTDCGSIEESAPAGRPVKRFCRLIFNSFFHPVEAIKLATDNLNWSLYRYSLIFCLISIIALCLTESIYFEYGFRFNLYLLYLVFFAFLPFILVPLLYFLLLDVTLRILSSIKLKTSGNLITDTSFLNNYRSYKTLLSVLNGSAPALMIAPILRFLLFLSYYITGLFNYNTFHNYEILWLLLIPATILFWFSWTYFVFRSFNLKTWLNILYAVLIIIIDCGLIYFLFSYFDSSWFIMN